MAFGAPLKGRRMTLAPLAESIAERLKLHKGTVAVAESSSGGLISAALLAVPGASAYFLGGAGVGHRLRRRPRPHVSGPLRAGGDGHHPGDRPVRPRREYGSLRQGGVGAVGERFGRWRVGLKPAPSAGSRPDSRPAAASPA